MNNGIDLSRENEYIKEMLIILHDVKTLDFMILQAMLLAKALNILDIKRNEVAILSMFDTPKRKLEMIKRGINFGVRDRGVYSDLFSSFLTEFFKHDKRFVLFFQDVKINDKEKIYELFDRIGDSTVALSKEMIGPCKNIYWLPTKELFQRKKLRKQSA